jgi:hypothetical protein
MLVEHRINDVDERLVAVKPKFPPQTAREPLMQLNETRVSDSRS